MYWGAGSIVCILTLLAAQQTRGLIDNGNSSLCNNECALGQYLSIPLNVDSDCWNICIEDGLMGSGSAPEVTGECLECHNSCLSCYGPVSNQCYSCPGFYLTLPHVNNNSTMLACDNGTIRNTSLEVRHCVSNCTSPFMLLADTGMECVCPRGYYPSIDGSLCLPCIENCSVCVDGTQTGCLQCSVTMHNDQCLGECPSGLINVNGNCETPVKNDLFPISRVALFTIIGAIGFIVLFISFWICCVIVIYLMWQKRKKKYMITTEGGTTISESFKKVKRNFSIKQRPPRPVSTVAVNNEYNQQRREIVSSEYDPYLKLNPGASVIIDEGKNVTHNQTSSIELQTDCRDNRHDSDDNEEEDEFYTDMTISSSNLIKNNGIPQPAHKPLGLTKSYEPPPPAKSNVGDRHSHRLSLPPQSPGHHVEIEQEIYDNPHADEDDTEDTASQENYMVMEHGQGYEQEEYVTSVGVNDQYQDEEQELYTEMDISGGPTIPKRAIVPPPAKVASGNKQTRKETLDNEYVTMTGRDNAKLRSYLSDEKLGKAPKYINVQRSGDPRLRSVTSPLQSSGPPAPPHTTEEDESFYGNVP